MTQVLFFDTETTGLPTKRNATPDEVDVWPRMTQLAWAIGDADSPPEARSCLIKPEGFTIDNTSKAVEITGITHERAMAEGIPLQAALEEFQDRVAQADIIAAHNLDFDYGVMGSELIRAGYWNVLEEKPRCCTMRCSTGLCKIPQKNGRGYKWPKLMELHQFLFGQGFDNAHDASADVAAGVKCYWELVRRGVLE